ncbi:MAG: phosphoribosyltransferase [Methanolobus sp.]|uniref:phosphoribosyltransferase n=1 Tax=Methanolobus sp. TaxID=1874737 RepID=UPI002731E41B|nr:phosphoribosyltransferase [Methanolobus sp.]MDP2217838.1 phosphoribosyltransferase [Methanolobus sp.]
MALPDKFKCVVTNWDYIYDLCREVADQVKTSGYQPDMIIALARGGWFGGRVLCDFLGLDDLTSLKIEHYIGTALAGNEPLIRYPLADNSVTGKNVLIVDDIADTGKSLLHSREYVMKQHPKEVRTATLQYLECSVFDPDYCGERLEEWAWVVYPWNLMEDMMDIISRLMAKENRSSWDIPSIRHGLYVYHSLDSFSFEIAQPGRLPEIMAEMTRRGIVKQTVENGKHTWGLA